VLTTALSSGDTLRPAIVCAASMKLAAGMVGSLPWCGAEPCPPVPLKVISQPLLAAVAGPGEMAKAPSGRSGSLCIP
jgi:hypothetical protein